MWNIAYGTSIFIALLFLKLTLKEWCNKSRLYIDKRWIKKCSMHNAQHYNISPIFMALRSIAKSAASRVANSKIYILNWIKGSITSWQNWNRIHVKMQKRKTEGKTDILRKWNTPHTRQSFLRVFNALNHSSETSRQATIFEILMDLCISHLSTSQSSLYYWNIFPSNFLRRLSSLKKSNLKPP